MMGQVIPHPPMNTSPLDDSLPHLPAWIHPRLAADAVVAKCRQALGFQAEQDFWVEFGRIYADAETTVRPEQRFAFATEVDGRLARMGLAPWSLMSRLRAPSGAPSGTRR